MFAMKLMQAILVEFRETAWKQDLQSTKSMPIIDHPFPLVLCYPISLPLPAHWRAILQRPITERGERGGEGEGVRELLEFSNFR